MDSHNVQRYVDSQGQVRNEGDVQVGGFSPYPISYRSIVPKESECQNLFVPVCLAATHIAYGSIRMEPVFMVLGQSSATAAVMAIDAGTSVQKVDYPKLRERLLADKQVLAWTGPQRRRRGIDPKSAARPGASTTTRRKSRATGAPARPSAASSARIYLHDNNGQKGQLSRDVPLRGQSSRDYTTCASPTRPMPTGPRTCRSSIQHCRRRIASVTLNQRTTPTIDKIVSLARQVQVRQATPSSSSPTPTPTATSSSTPCSSPVSATAFHRSRRRRSPRAREAT